MQIKTAEYVKSAPTFDICPEPTLPEFAFIGRSNVGKSSLINMLTNHKKLAQVSGKPGKTKLINHFIVNGEWYLVDLPGYGYAHISQMQREQWLKNTEEYLIKRPNLYTVFQLIDSNVPPQKNDLNFTNWLGENQIPFAIVFTKADRAKTTELQKNVAAYKRALKNTWVSLPQMFVSSAEEKRGRDEILDYISKVIKEVK